MSKFLLTLSCLASLGFHAPRPTELGGYEKIARQRICEMDFWYNGQWVKAIDTFLSGVEVQANPEANFRFSIWDEKLKELLEQVDSPDPKTFKGSELSPDYPNILQYMQIKIEKRSLPGFIVNKAYSILKQTEYQPKYFFIELQLPEMEVDMGDLLIQRVVRGRLVSGAFNLVRKQKIRIGEDFILCSSPLDTQQELLNECHEIIGNKWICAFSLWTAGTVNEILNQRPESEIAFDYVYENLFAYGSFKVPIVIQKRTEKDRIKIRVKFNEISTLLFHYNGKTLWTKLSLTYPQIILAF